MAGICVFSLVMLATIVTVQGSSNFASYTKTEIHSALCADKPMDTKHFRGKLQCGRFCTRESHCRRFLFCLSNSECKIFTDGTECVMSSDSTDCVCFKKTMGYVNSALTCPYGFYGNSCQHVVTGCKEAFSLNMTTINRGSFARTFVKPNPSSPPFQVYCHLDHGGGTLIMERTSYCDHLMFNRTMEEYAQPFGSGKENIWIGFSNLISLQTNRPFSYIQMLLFTPEWKMCSAFFSGNPILSNTPPYMLSNSQHSAQDKCNNSMLANSSLSSTSFSTKDYEATGRNCAAIFGGGLWFDPSMDCSKIKMANTMDGLASENSWLDSQGHERIIKMSLLIYC